MTDATGGEDKCCCCCSGIKEQNEIYELHWYTRPIFKSHHFHKSDKMFQQARSSILQTLQSVWAGHKVWLTGEEVINDAGRPNNRRRRKTETRQWLKSLQTSKVPTRSRTSWLPKLALPRLSVHRGSFGFSGRLLAPDETRASVLLLCVWWQRPKVQWERLWCFNRSFFCHCVFGF